METFFDNFARSIKEVSSVSEITFQKISSHEYRNEFSAIGLYTHITDSKLTNISHENSKFCTVFCKKKQCKILNFRVKNSSKSVRCGPNPSAEFSLFNRK
jgi:uncharacterized protein YjaZ